MSDEKYLSPVSQERIQEKLQKSAIGGKTQNTEKRLPRKHEKGNSLNSAIGGLKIKIQ